MNLLESAKSYAKSGLSVISTNDIKKAVMAWKPYQSNIPTDQQLEAMFTNPATKGLAIICGAVSGNLEVIDIDCKYGINFEDYANRIKEANQDLYNKLYIIETVSKGYHIYYKCEFIEGNKKLAQRHPTEDEKSANPMSGPAVLIETRGEAGYVCAPPSHGYKLIQGQEIPVIELQERELLLTIARSFNQVLEMVKQPNIPHNNDKVTVWDDFNRRGDVVALLEKHGWQVIKRQSDKILFKRPGDTKAMTSAVLFTDKEPNIFYPHTTSTSFENKGYTPFGVYTHLECKSDYKKATKQLSEKYGEVNNDGWFWSYNRNNGVVLSRYELQKWLYDNNFQLYFQNDKTGSYRLIHENERKVKEIHPEAIKKHIKHALEAAGHIDVIEALMKQTNSIFTDSFFEYIEKSEIKILHDDDKHAYFPFINGICKVSANNIELIEYANINESIWQTQIIDYWIDISKDFDPTSGVFAEFISKICEDNPERIKYAYSLIGYILHSYKDPSKPYAVILAEETDDESKGGGTGKGLFFMAISKIIPTVKIDGKNFKPDKTFAFQRVELGTQLVVIEDCPRNVDFERYYPTITEGITIEKKNQDEVFLKYSESPKIAFTTNYAIASNAEHAKRRQKILEFAPFFNSKYTPKEHFKHTLFYDWDTDEWTKFYNLMFYCVKQYLAHGIADYNNSEKLARKTIKVQFGEEFLEYFLDLMETYPGKTLEISKEWEGFLVRACVDKKEYSMKRFKKALVNSADIMKIDYKEFKNAQIGNHKCFILGKGQEVKSEEGWQSYLENNQSDEDLERIFM